MPSLLLCAAQAGSALDDFDADMNPNGWNFAPRDVIRADGGNPLGWLHGDGITRISFDAQAIHTDLPVVGGYNISLLLRDDKGTANVKDDD